MKFDENEVFDLIQTYYSNPGDTRSQVLVLEALYDRLKGLQRHEEKLYRVTLTDAERRSEGFYALLGALERSREDHKDFAARFVALLGPELNKYIKRRSDVSIEEDTVEDPALGPEDAYILKEQIELVKEFLQKHYSSDTVEMFIRRYGDGETLEALGHQWGISNQAIADRLCPIMRRVRKYMKRMLEHGVNGN